MSKVVLRTLIALVVLVDSGGAAVLAARQDPPASKLSGCVERDAASSAPVYKLVTARPDGRPQVFVLRAPKEIDLKGAVGKRASVTGQVGRERAAGRDIDVIDVRSLDVTGNCNEATARQARAALVVLRGFRARFAGRS